MTKQQFQNQCDNLRERNYNIWMDKYPKLVNVLLWIEVIIMAWVIFTYDFTTNY